MIQTIETKIVKRYNAHIEFDGTDWITTEQFNNLGTVEITGSTDITIQSAQLFTTGKTSVKYSSYKNGAVSAFYIYQLDNDTIVLNNYAAPAEGDVVMLEIEVFTTKNQ